MSCEKVSRFLEEKEKNNNQETENEVFKDSAELRYRVLSHYNLGEKTFYKEGDNADDFPFTVWDCGMSKRFRYDCEVSDEDFERIYEIYKKETKSPDKNAINDNAEKTLGIIAIIALVAGVLSFIVCFIVGIVYEEWGVVGAGVGVLFASLVCWAFIKVFVNISYKLDRLNR